VVIQSVLAINSAAVDLSTCVYVLSVVIETVVMVISAVHVTCGLLVMVVLATVAIEESSATEDGVADVETAAAVEALARALQNYRRPAQLVDAAAKKREAALDVDYGWGGGRFGKRRMADRLGMAGRFGRSVDGASRSSLSSASRTQDD